MHDLLRTDWSLARQTEGVTSRFRLNGSAIAEGPREALVIRNPATTKHLENPIVWHCLRDSTFSRCDTIPEWDKHTHRQTDGQTHDDGIYRT